MPKRTETLDLRIVSSALEKAKLTIEEFAVLYVYYCGVDLQSTLNSLAEKKYLVPPDLFLNPEDYSISSIGKGKVEAVFEESSSDEISEDRLKELAIKMKEIYPKGKKFGTNFYWSDGIVLIMRRLKVFFAKYGTEFSDEQILDATKRYVEDKLDDPTMRLLKYFIFKEGIGNSGEVEPTSDLLTYIENADDDDSKEWGTELR